MADQRKGDRHAHETISFRPSVTDRARLLALAGCEHERCGDGARCNTPAVRRVISDALTAYLDAHDGSAAVLMAARTTGDRANSSA